MTTSSDSIKAKDYVNDDWKADWGDPGPEPKPDPKKHLTKGEFLQKLYDSVKDILQDNQYRDGDATQKLQKLLGELVTAKELEKKLPGSKRDFLKF